MSEAKSERGWDKGRERSNEQKVVSYVGRRLCARVRSVATRISDRQYDVASQSHLIVLLL